MIANTTMAVSAALLLVWLAAPTFAEDRGMVTTAEVGNVADAVIHDTTCQEFLSALDRAGNATDTTDDALIVILGLVFMQGYSVGAGLGEEEGMTAFLSRCYDMPGLLLSRMGQPPR